MLHPYPRQSLFGPTIRGKPWCVWEAEVRYFVHPEEYEKTLAAKILRWFGVKSKCMESNELFDHVEIFPLLLSLTEDSDRDVRYLALRVLTGYDQFRDRSAIPVLRRRLKDSDSCCRIHAASAIWFIDRTEPVLEVLLREIDGQVNGDRTVAIGHLASWSQRDPSLFPHLAKCAADQDANVRAHTMLAIQLQGDMALPVLCKGMDDPDVSVRRMAINSISVLPSPAKEAMPGLLRCLNDPDREVRDRAGYAIRTVDPDRYERLRAERRIE
jgi:HEAT repeat protein